MKFYLAALLSFFSVSSFATVQTPSDRLVDFLESLGVDSFGKRKSLYAELHCKMKATGPFCTLHSEKEEIGIFEEYEGDVALDLMSILTDLGVDPEGKKQQQWARVVCRLPKGVKVGKRVCTVQPDVVIISP